MYVFPHWLSYLPSVVSKVIKYCSIRDYEILCCLWLEWSRRKHVLTPGFSPLFFVSTSCCRRNDVMSERTAQVKEVNGKNLKAC